MEFLKKVFPYLDKFLLWITTKRAIYVFLFSLVIIFSLTLFEERKNFNFEKNPKLSVSQIKLNTVIETHAKEIVDRFPEVLFVKIVSADIRINQREVAFFYTKDTFTKIVFEESLRGRGTNIVPIFSNNQKENAIMVSLINGDFVCYRYEDSTNMIFAPRGATSTPELCNISLPPYYGEFSGYLSFGLTKKIDTSKLSELKLEGTRLSTEIYFKNFGHRI